MKKLSALFIALVFAMAFASYVYAGSADARTATTGKGISQVNGIGDLSTGNTAEIDTNGAVAATERAIAVTSAYNDSLVYTGACYVKSITIKGISAADSAAVYDAVSATGTPKFDPTVDTNNGSFNIDAKGAPFATGIYVDTNDGDVFYTIVYDY